MARERLGAPVRTDDDLFRLWQALMGPGGFAQRTLWLTFLYPDGYPAKVIVPIDDIPVEPDVVAIGNLGGLARDLDVGVTSMPTLISRPGPGAMTAADRRWAVALREHGGPFVRRWPIHLATTDRVQVFAPDDVIVASRHA